MRLEEFPWLTDENIHPEVVAYLRSRGFDVLDVKEQGWQGRKLVVVQGGLVRVRTWE